MKHFLSVSLLSILLSLISFHSAVAAATQVGETAAGVYQGKHARVSLSLPEQLIAGQVNYATLVIEAEEGWHTYWKNPGDTGKPTEIDWRLPNGFIAGQMLWPVPERIDYQGLINYGYHGAVELFTPISVPNELQGIDSGVVDIQAEVKWLICREICIPDSTSFVLEASVVSALKQSGAQLMSALAGGQEIGNRIQDKHERPIPKFLDKVAGNYAVKGDSIVVKVEQPSLPVFKAQPVFFVGHEELVDHQQLPEMHFQDDSLFLIFKVNGFRDVSSESAEETLPNYLNIVIAQQELDAAVSAYEIQLRYTPELLESTKLSTAGFLQKDVSHVTPHPEGESNANNSLLVIIISAFLGGVILNAMPCVFPVLSLKVLGLVEHAGGDTNSRKTQANAYLAGVVSSFLVVALALISLRSFGQQIGWGFQLQNPLFVGSLVYIMYIIGLSLSGFYEFGSSLQNVGSGLLANNNSDVKNSFFTGVLATVVATPCTAPFMGVAIGFALSQPIYLSLLVFVSMGLGLAAPFWLVGYLPQLANRLPRPGNWMNTFKELLAFPMYLTAIWLLWVFSNQTNTIALTILLIGLVIITFGLWALKRLGGITKRPTFTVALIASMVLLVQAASIERDAVVGDVTGQQYAASDIDGGLPYDQALLDQLLSERKTIFVNMTADWCITCKINERVVLKTEKIRQLFLEYEVNYVKGDWTNSDPEITAYLEKFGRSGVPLYVVYKNGEAPMVLPQILTTSIVIDAIN